MISKFWTKDTHKPLKPSFAPTEKGCSSMITVFVKASLVASISNDQLKRVTLSVCGSQNEEIFFGFLSTL